MAERATEHRVDRRDRADVPGFEARPAAPVPPAMRLPALALSCSAAGVSAALIREQGHAPLSIECWQEPAGSGRSDSLLAIVDGLLRANGVGASSLRHLIVDVGPGPFTALRAACSVAQGISLATGASADAVWSTEALALQATDGCGAGNYTVLVAIDARMGEVYVATVRVELDRLGQPLRVTEARPCLVTAPERAWDEVGPGIATQQGTTLLVAGNARGADPAFADSLIRAARSAGWSLSAPPGATSVRADAVARVGLLRARRRIAAQAINGRWSAASPEGPDPGRVDESGPTPRYVRNKVALDLREQSMLRERSAGTAAPR